MSNTGNDKALENLLRGETEKLTRQFGGAFQIRYAPMQEEIHNLGKVLDRSSHKFITLLLDTHDTLAPHTHIFNFNHADLEELSFFKFLDAIRLALTKNIDRSVNNVQKMLTTYNRLKPVLKGNTDLGNLSVAEESAIQLLSAAREEFVSILEFNTVVAGVYLSTKREYKKLRRKFLGGSGKQDKKDDLEESMMMQIFGIQSPPTTASVGPAVSLVDNNCVLTQLLDDLSETIPTYYEKTVPILQRGIATTKTKTVKNLDEGETEEYSQLLITIANETILSYIETPDVLLTAVLDIMQRYYELLDEITEVLEALLRRIDMGLGRRQPIVNPMAIARQYKKINFLAIQPLAEDVAPRTRVEREFSVARTNLLTYLKDTLFGLKSMTGEDNKIIYKGVDAKVLTLSDTPSTKDQYSMARVQEIIKLKAVLDDVNRTERDKALTRNIRDDNEFYISKSGDIGALQAEREPAPRTTYEEVIGNSFIVAKEHIEEVVKIASHANIMRISAPRGDVRSNLLLIGPYGCGKTILAAAVGGDKRIIGFNLSTADILTAYMHESVKNVKRLYELAKGMRKQSRDTKPVAVLLDEFDRLFNYGEGVNQAYDGPRMEGVLQEMMDGVVGYEGVFLVALTNSPKTVPEAILRRFKYVDVVGQLSDEERATLFEQFLTRGLPIAESVSQENYLTWAKQMEHAPGDVIGKVADEVHFKFMKEFIDRQGNRTELIEKTLKKRLAHRDISKRDFAYLKTVLAKYKTIDSSEINSALETILKQPQVRMQIRKAKEVYRDADEIMHNLSLDKGIGFGATVGRRSDLWNDRN